jgi:hypothetical protein
VLSSCLRSFLEDDARIGAPAFARLGDDATPDAGRDALDDGRARGAR